MTSHRVKDHVRDSIEMGFDRLHRVADIVTFPLAPIDGAIHGVARGLFNWVMDEHPGDRKKGKPAKAPPPPPPPPPAPLPCYPDYYHSDPSPNNGYYPYPPPGPPYAGAGYPPAGPPPLPYYYNPYWPPPQMGGPGSQMGGIGSNNTGNDNGNNGTGKIEVGYGSGNVHGFPSTPSN